MEVRLVALLASFIEVSTEYALARLEVTMLMPDAPVPPVISRPSEASEDALRREWPEIETALDAARAYLKAVDREEGGHLKEESAYGWLRRTVKELDQYARAVRWVLTITEREED
ncbi:MAG: hypothetical protein JOZ38_09095 [Candidatus Eremiobacteraeota bacterium]|nr:hypothetical protein [Candidatus Eremiobacteraeota bacterium]